MLKSQKSAVNYLRNELSTSIFVPLATHKEIEEIISIPDSSKSIGPFSMRINLLKVLKLCTSNPFTKLFNKSFVKGVFHQNSKLLK